MLQEEAGTLTMSDATVFNVETYRRTHESGAEWKLRRQFILRHHDQFEHDRLMCLANCFINVECYGCRYPEQVMIQLKELASQLDEGDISKHRHMIASSNAVKFVKAK